MSSPHRPTDGAHPLRDRLRTLFLEPSNRAPISPELRSQARLLSALLIVSTLGMIAASFAPTIGPLYRAFSAGVIVHNLLAYALNRFGFTYAPLVTTILSVFASSFMLLFSRAEFSVVHVDQTFMILNAGILFAFLLLPLGTFAVTSGAIVLAASQMWRVIPAIDPARINVVVLTTLAVLAMTLFASYLRRQHRRKLDAQRGALEASERRYRELLNATSEGIIIHKNGVIIDVNPAFTRFTGYALEELIGSHISRLYAPEYRERIPAYLKTNEPYQTEGLLRDGTRCWLEVRGHDFEYAGERVRAATIRDISQQREYEERRIKLEREQERVRLLREFIGNLSHDLRTPLSVIKTNAYLIRKLSADPAAVGRKLEAIEAQVDHLHAVFTDLLDMARLDRADTTQYHFEALDPPAIILPVVKALRSTLDLHGHTLTLDLPADLPRIWGDGRELPRVLRHLIDNAIAYTPRNGTIRVFARVTPASASATRPELTISVQDNGIGIDPAALPHLFDAFYRVDNARSIETGGTGVGLSIANRIAMAHGGSITVNSVVGQGSTFCLHLPLAEEIGSTDSGGRRFPGEYAGPLMTTEERAPGGN